MPPRVLPLVLALAAGLTVGLALQSATGQDPADGVGAASGDTLPAFDPTTTRPDPAPDGVRRVTIEATDAARDIYRGIDLPVVAFNGQFPGPTLRAIQGETVHVTLHNNASTPMTLHFHGYHEAQYDGVHEVVPPGGSEVYVLETPVAGIFVYHSHVSPAALRAMHEPTGVLIVDPVTPRLEAREYVLHAKADDADLDFEEAEFYTFNGQADAYLDAPLDAEVGELVRLYLVNVNMETSTFHVHGTTFNATTMGTPGNPTVTTDSLQMGYAERQMVEVSWPHPGLWMFHDHIAEHLDRGMRGWFRVTAAAAGGDGA